MTRGRCGLLHLHRGGLSPPTSCRRNRRTLLVALSVSTGPPGLFAKRQLGQFLGRRRKSGPRTDERLLLAKIRDRLFGLTSRSPRAPNLGRRPAVDFSKVGVEPSQAPESCPHRDLGHWQAGLVEEAFGS